MGATVGQCHVKVAAWAAEKNWKQTVFAVTSGDAETLSVCLCFAFGGAWVGSAGSTRQEADALRLRSPLLLKGVLRNVTYTSERFAAMYLMYHLYEW